MFGELDARQALDAIMSRADVDGVRLQLSDRTSGTRWEGGQVDLADSDPGRSGCHIQVNAGSPIVEAMIAEVAGEDPTGKIRSMNGLVTLTLAGGEVDWSVVRAVWIAVRSLWGAIGYDEVSGFAADFDEL
ncbi:hypothetical protein FNH05_08385 [Amycolatopsis rhizosphaerae]|uniref:Uncharacterized protein n=1 Tax=Amycolatopsis rhizosphaerae TaxID=2053003 RepID=A0A558D5R3_9PSEU|nr:hypothetical protein [Amycolatopsis rhizosphaerae]TVT56342.1 hypothetical protein FNH05_08385 [Amycolatopsis rhizosphaerae]